MNNIMKHKKFTSEQIREICKIFIDTKYSLNDEGISYILNTIKVEDYDPNSPKQNRLYKDLLHAQENTNDGGKILDFISTALNPVNYIDHKDIFIERLNHINTIISSFDLEFREDGKCYVTKELNISDKPSFNIILFIKNYKVAILLITGIVFIATFTVIKNLTNENELTENIKQKNSQSNIPETDVMPTTETIQDKQKEFKKTEGPSINDIEKEVMNIVSNLSPDSYQYNATTFLDTRGVFKNLIVTNIRINSRNGIKKSERLTDTDEEQMILNISGITDLYDVVGFNQYSYSGSTNFVIEKEFRFLFRYDKKTKSSRWVGYVYDYMRDKKTLRFKKGYYR
jgi:hypothetical protein